MTAARAGDLGAALAAASTQPWWAIPAFTLGGTVLGALITQVFTVLAAQRKMDADRRAAGQLLRRETLIALIVAAHDVLAAGDEDREVKDSAFRACFARAQLVLSRGVLPQADAFFRAVEQLLDEDRRPDRDAGRRVQLNVRAGGAEQALVAAARSAPDDFGLPDVVASPLVRVRGAPVDDSRPRG